MLSILSSPPKKRKLINELFSFFIQLNKSDLCLLINVLSPNPKIVKAFHWFFRSFVKCLQVPESIRKVTNRIHWKRPKMSFWPCPAAWPEPSGKTSAEVTMRSTRAKRLHQAKPIYWVYSNWNDWLNKQHVVITNYSGSSTNGTFSFSLLSLSRFVSQHNRIILDSSSSRSSPVDDTTVVLSYIPNDQFLVNQKVHRFIGIFLLPSFSFCFFCVIRKIERGIGVARFGSRRWFDGRRWILVGDGQRSRPRFR